MLGEKAECSFDSIPQLKPQGSPNAGGEGSMCNSSPAFVHILNLSIQVQHVSNCPPKSVHI